MDYTKDTLDFTSSDIVSPKPGQLYIGWQDAGEWANYTVYVHQKGKYIIYTSYSSTENNPAELWINTAFAGKLTFHEKTGNQHSWTQSEAGEISFPHAGVYLLTLKFGTGVNYGYLDFLYNDARQ